MYDASSVKPIDAIPADAQLLIDNGADIGVMLELLRELKQVSK